MNQINIDDSVAQYGLRSFWLYEIALPTGEFYPSYRLLYFTFRFLRLFCT